MKEETEVEGGQTLAQGYKALIIQGFPQTFVASWSICFIWVFLFQSIYLLGLSGSNPVA
jgi:hypothetical protein